MTSDQSEGVPESIVEDLERLSDPQLREVIKFAQQRLKQRHDPTTEIEARHEHEEILSIDDKGDYALVIVDEESDPEGPITYHVSADHDPESKEWKYEWRYLGHLKQD